MRRVIRVRFGEGDVAYRLYGVGKDWVKRSPYTTLLLYVFHIMSINFIRDILSSPTPPHFLLPLVRLY